MLGGLRLGKKKNSEGGDGPQTKSFLLVQIIFFSTELFAIILFNFMEMSRPSMNFQRN